MTDTSYNAGIYFTQGSTSLVLGNITFSIDTNGNVIISGLPTSNPHVVGALWNNNGTLAISAGA